MKKLTLLAAAAIAVALCLALAGCQSAAVIPLRNNDTLSFQGKTATLNLAANPSTGFSWTFETTTLTGDATLTCADDAFKSNATQKNTTGAGGTQTFKFESSGTGTSELRLHYLRVWEEDAPLANYTFEFIADNGTIKEVVVK